MKTTLLLASLAGLSLLVPAQKRATPAEPKDFDKLIKTALQEYGAKKYGRCMSALEEARNLVRDLWTKGVAEALPAAPEGWTRTIEDTSKEAAAAAAFGLGAFAGNTVRARYEGPDGKQFELTVTLFAPMVAALKMMFDNPMMRPENSEFIEYEGYKGLLEKEGETNTVKILLDGKHFLEGKGSDLSADEILKWASQENVDRIRQAISG
jgi:hypothetical protein